MIYLCSPYSHPDPTVREARFHAARAQAAAMLREGIQVFSPIAYSHSLVECGLPVEWHFWERLDRVLLEICSEVQVLMLDGWEESQGIQAEICLARELGKPVIYLKPFDDQTPVTASRAGAVEGKAENAPTL